MKDNKQSNWEAAFSNYLKETDWELFEDHYSSMGYCPAMLKEIHTGATPAIQQSLLDEIVARLYHQESLSTGIHVIIEPLLMLCVMDRINIKSQVLEFILEIQQRYLFLKGVIGTQPYKYAYLGDFYSSDETSSAAIESGEKPYYESIKRNRHLLVELIKDSDPYVKNLAIKAYGLSAKITVPDEASIPVDPLVESLNNDQTKYNTLVTIGFISQLLKQPKLLENYNAGSNLEVYYWEISKGLAGIAEAKILMNLTPATIDPVQFPWYGGYAGLLAMAAIINSNNNTQVTEYLIQQINQLKETRSHNYNTEWQPYEILAEWIAMSFLAPLVPAGHKRSIQELSSDQIGILQQLSRNKIITHVQVLAGLPNTLSGINYLVSRSSSGM